MYVARMCRGVLPHMQKTGGSILNITAISAIQPIPRFGLSVASWGAVIGYAKTLALETARFGINVNTICPGYIDTQRLEKVFSAGEKPAQQMRSELEQEVPLGRIGTVERYREPRRAAGVAARQLHHRHRHSGRWRPVPRGPLREEVMAYVNMMPAELAAKYTREKLWMQKTVFDILAEQAARHPDRIAIRDQRGAIDYRELKDRIERSAQFYRSIGISRGDVVTIQLPNRIEFAVAFIALELLGAIANKVNPDFRARELSYMLKFSGSSAYVFPKEWKDFDYAGMARGLQRDNPDIKRLIVVGGAVEGMHDFDAGVAAATPISATDKVHMDPNEVCRMCFTSGTTRRSEVRPAQFQHYALCGRVAQSRHGGDRTRGVPGVSPTRLELGLYHAFAEHPGRRDAGVNGAL